MNKIETLNILTNIERGAADDLAIRLMKHGDMNISYYVYITSFSFKKAELTKLRDLQALRNVSGISYNGRYIQSGTLRFLFNLWNLTILLTRRRLKIVEVSSVNDSILIFFLICII